ncbi:hypothetical protein HY948_03390 [Candidatus Gottesmanbacteria bacterium]|nr:hypothetical protein [Candidatus Gottesmanbacteria bacterium]
MNLLPAEEKIKMVKSYRTKIFVVAATFTAYILILSIAPLVASYLAVSYKEAIFNNELAIVKDAREDGLDSYTIAIKDANLRIAQLNKVDTGALGFQIYDLLKSIVQYVASVKDSKGSHVSIASISYDYRLPSKKDKPSVALGEFHYNKIMLSGRASDRITLQSFIQLLKNDSRFAKVESPISNFIVSKDVNFSVTISLKN